MPASPLSGFGDYTIIHPTQEAEEDTWAGVAATSKILYRHYLSINAPLGMEKSPDRKSRSRLSVVQGQSKDICGLLFYMAATAVFLLLL